METTFTGADEARQFRAEHDQDARQLSHKSKRELERIAAGLRPGVRVYGQSSHDELVSEILGHRYPAARLNETTHMLYHQPGETWSACEWCHPHQGAGCDCSLGRASAAATS